MQWTMKHMISDGVGDKGATENIKGKEITPTPVCIVWCGDIKIEIPRNPITLVDIWFCDIGTSLSFAKQANTQLRDHHLHLILWLFMIGPHAPGKGWMIYQSAYSSTLFFFNHCNIPGRRHFLSRYLVRGQIYNFPKTISVKENVSSLSQNLNPIYWPHFMY